jgi:GT2 family glycosyltransferase
MYGDTTTTAPRSGQRPIQQIAAVVVSWNRADLTIKAVQSVRESVQSVYVLDNGSAEDDFAMLQTALRGPAVTLMRADTNLGYAGGNNLAVTTALAGGCDTLLIINNDVLAEPGAIEALSCHLDAHPTVGVAMPTVVAANGGHVLHRRCSLNRRSGTARWEGTGGCIDDAPSQPEPTDYVSGEAFLCRAEVFQRCGLFDERFFCYYEDVDWSLRVGRMGWGLDYVPRARFRHEVGGSGASAAGAFYRARNRVLLHRYALGRTRWGAAVRSLCPLARSAGAHIRQGRHAEARQVAAGLFAGLGSDQA